MSKIIPFKALLPTPEVAPKMISPPYDVISTERARQIADKNPFSFLHVTKAQIDLPPDMDEYDDTVYQQATANLRLFEERGYLVHGEPSFFVYRLSMGGHVQTGLVAGASVDDYERGAIRKHERTREEKVTDRARHSYTVQAHAEPVMLVHSASDAIRHLVGETETMGVPLFDTADRDGVRHTLWRVHNAVPVQRAFEGVEVLYIADGHHRSESALKVRNLMAKENVSHRGAEPYNYFPAVIFPHDEVRIFEYEWDGDPADRPLSRYSMGDIMKLADEGGIMPPKSTWFAPKLGSGLFIYTF